MFEKKYYSPFEINKCTQDKILVQNIKLGSKLIVEENQIAFVVIKRKLCDKFSTCEIKLEKGVLPETYKATNLGQEYKGNVSKKTYYKNDFKGSIIFINVQPFRNFSFKTSTILLFDRLDEFKFKLNGRYDFEIVNIDVFAKFVAKCGKSNEYITTKINEYVSKKLRYELHKEHFEIEYFIMKDNTVFQNIIEKLNKRMKKIGIKITDILMTDFVVNEKYNRKINQYISSKDIKIHYQKL